MGSIRVLILGAALAALMVATAPDAAPALAAPANDNFANATTIVATATDPVVAAGNTSGATMEAGEPTSCFTGATAWFNWTSPAFTGAVSFDAYGSSLDTVLGVYTGNAVNALSAIGCSDTFGGPQGGVGFNFAASTTYRIQVGGYLGATGDFILNVSFGASMVVNTAADAVTADNFLSLREAILAASSFSSPCALLTAAEQQQVLNCGWGGLAASDLIHFNPGAFPPGAPASILLGSSLPTMASGDTISGIGAGVVVDGQNATAFACFTISGTSNAIQGLDIRGCARGVIISTGSSNLIGIDISSPYPLPQQRNIIRENGNGVRITSAFGDNRVYGNYIGTNPAGADVGNGTGVLIESPAFQLIGSAGLGRNVISGNGFGVHISGGNSQTTVSGNHIGTNPAGTAALGNDQEGVFIADGNSVSVVNNLISGNGLAGIKIAPSFAGSGWARNNVIQGNLIGTDVTGTVPIPNDDSAVTLSNAPGNTIGGTVANQRNVLSGNTGDGVLINGPYATRNTVLGNYIGTNAAGTAAIANGVEGVQVTGNATSNTVGGSTPGSRNVISGNYDGVFINGPGGGVSNYASTDVPKAINDFTTTTSTITVPELATVTDIDILFNITHTFTGDLTIQLLNPDGVPVLLAANLGGGGDNYTNTYLDDDPVPGIRIIDVGAPFTGSFLPQTPLSQLDGSSTRGDWTLSVHDGAGADIGTLNSWSLRFTTNGNEVAGNYIGTNAAGSHALGNSPGAGVLIINSPFNTIGGSVAGARNVISGNASLGVLIQGVTARDNRVAGNYIGTDAAGTVDRGNGTGGVYIVGAPYNRVGGGAADRNVISGNNANGVQILDADAVGNAVMSNYIGTNAAGNADLGNTLHGVYVASAGVNQIGAPIGAGNVISGNDQDGVRLLTVTAGTLVQSNFIGTDASGTAAIGNSLDGISILGTSTNIEVGGAAAVERNVISGNTGRGIQIGQPGTGFNYIWGNYIGTKLDGVSALGNGAGILIFGGAVFNDIGGTLPGQGNTIAHNATTGIALSPSGGNPTDNAFRQNRMFGNGGLGIDLGLDGITANDASDGDTGPNERQNYPQLISVDHSGGSVHIAASLNSLPFNAYVVEFFVSPSCDPSGYGEGADLVGSMNVGTDANGNVSFVASFASAPLAGFLTATATDDDVDDVTSEFAACFPAEADADNDDDGDLNPNDNCPYWGNPAQNLPPWAVPAGDPDCDGFTNAREAHVGTDPTKHCNGTPDLNDEADAWPTDFNDSRFTTLADVSSFNPTYNKFPGDAGYSQRHDLNASNGVTLSDVSLMNVFYNKSCT